MASSKRLQSRVYGPYEECKTVLEGLGRKKESFYFYLLLSKLRGKLCLGDTEISIGRHISRQFIHTKHHFGTYSIKKMFAATASNFSPTLALSWMLSFLRLGQELPDRSIAPYTSVKHHSSYNSTFISETTWLMSVLMRVGPEVYFWSSLSFMMQNPLPVL